MISQETARKMLAALRSAEVHLAAAKALYAQREPLAQYRPDEHAYWSNDPARVALYSSHAAVVASIAAAAGEAA
ncbi:hypothetical protein [Rhodovarius crocodyli]|uniref:hypothetical protein n=1 Tax=Rhodovarius crocodyli TaxID=1979269 RepID=UPI000FD6E50D|nr:hypothetical protein [Rhodovarius crocodyli]